MPHRPSLFVPLALALAFVTAAAFAGPGGVGQSDAKFTGLPTTGQIDDQQVVQARYGAGPDQPMAGVGAAGVPRDFKGGITGVALDSTSDTDQKDVPFTFGQVFAPGDVKPSDRLVGKLAGGADVPLQVDVKARHPDGSVRHAVVSAVLPALDAHQTLTMTLAKGGVPVADADKGAAGPKVLLDQGFKACVDIRAEGQAWSACADRLLAAKPPASWLAGPVAREWLVAAPLRNAQGVEHPHLAARFALRWYPRAHKARVDVTVENDWAFEPKPRNLRYDVDVTIGGKPAYAQQGLEHFHHARWRKVFWWGEAPAVVLRRDSAYLMATGALPHYDPTVRVAGKAITDLAARWTGKAIEPMGAGLVTPYMPTTGGRQDIGILPAWSVLYLLGMDPRAGRATMGTSDLSGSWSIHYRDKRTDLPVSLVDHPYMTLLGHPSDAVDPATGKSDAFPGCAAEHACDSPYTPDGSHQPSLAYLPYLLSGDRFDLEELQFWATYDALSSNPNYRDAGKGLLKSDQVRGQAWGLRTLGEAAYITPDDDRLKAYFVGVVVNNLRWYNATYTDNPGANKLGILVNGYAYSYNNETAIAPWQDDFFTSSVGHLAEMGFKDAHRLLAWKARFAVGRMTAPGACWIDGAAYNLTVRRTRESPVFATMAEAYAASHPPEVAALPCAGDRMASALKLRTGEMTGFSDAPIGFPSNMQPALAYAVDAGGERAKSAWTLFMSRSVKPDYGVAPQFAIVPRRVVPDAPTSEP